MVERMTLHLPVLSMKQYRACIAIKVIIILVSCQMKIFAGLKYFSTQFGANVQYYFVVTNTG